MRVTTALALALALFVPLASAQIVPEEISIETMSNPGPNWFISKTGNGGYIFDAATGEMQGMLSLSRYTPAVTMWQPRREFYATESYLSRGVRGERTDLVAVYDFENLSPVAEIIIPNHKILDLLPRTSAVRKLQRDLVKHYQLNSTNVGNKLNRRVRIYPN